MPKTVAIYSTPTCHFCKEAKAFFAEKHIEYTEYDVAGDAARRKEMIDLTGQLGVPVIVIDGKAAVGFDPDEVAERLGIAA
ncbi:MAG: glutaredoxin family protein [Patescibacteria group bacterium]